MFVTPTVSVEKTIEALNARGIQAERVASKAEAHDRLTSLIPDGASVMTAGSLTLKQIGFEERLISKDHRWNNLKDALLAEQDPVRQAKMRREASLADYFVGSVQAIAESGEVVLVSAGGSQLAPYVFSSPHVIWVAGAQKIVPDLDTALRRIREYALPIEDQRMKSLGRPGSFIGKIVIFEREPVQLGREIRLILVDEEVGV